MSKVQSLLNNETYTLGEPVSHREFHLVMLVVIAEVLNPGNTLHILSFGSVSDIPLVTTGWDVARLTDRVKNTRVKKDGSQSVADQNLEKYVEQSEFGRLQDPTTILDCHGCILLWHLPGTFTKKCTVRIIFCYMTGD